MLATPKAAIVNYLIVAVGDTLTYIILKTPTTLFVL